MLLIVIIFFCRCKGTNNFWIVQGFSPFSHNFNPSIYLIPRTIFTTFFFKRPKVAIIIIMSELALFIFINANSFQTFWVFHVIVVIIAFSMSVFFLVPVPILALCAAKRLLPLLFCKGRSADRANDCLPNLCRLVALILELSLGFLSHTSICLYWINKPCELKNWG